MEDKSASGYHIEFRKQITNLSNADNYKEALTEWRLQKVMYDRLGNFCICKKYIHHLCHIINVENGKMTIIGSDCCEHIDNSMKKEAKEKIDRLKYPYKWCQYCNTRKKKVRNEEIYYCKSCNAYKIIDFGKHKGLLYHDVYDNDKSYCKWVLTKENPKDGLLKFKNFLLSCKSN
jgi:hypothetical protein